jgi:hypothetical protein
MAARTARAVPVPPAEVHRSELVVVHDVVTQTVLPTCAVGVEEPTPKPIPENVSVAAPEAGAFGWASVVGTGVTLLKFCKLSDPAQSRNDRVVPRVP